MAKTMMISCPICGGAVEVIQRSNSIAVRPVCGGHLAGQADRQFEQEHFTSVLLLYPAGWHFHPATRSQNVAEFPSWPREVPDRGWRR